MAHGALRPEAAPGDLRNLLIHPDHPKIGDVTLAIEREPFEFDPRLA